MEQQINQQQFTQSEKNVENKTSKLIFIITVSFILGALFVGTIEYFVLNNKYLKTQSQFNKQISELQNQINTLKQKKETIEMQNRLNQNYLNEQKPTTVKAKNTLKKIKEDKRFVYYEGSITVSGKYQEFFPEALLGGKLCFYPDKETEYLIPRNENLGIERDTRTPWFCFANQNKAKEMFGINDNQIFSDKTVQCIQGKATVEISNYVIDKLEGEVFDTANLDNTIYKENYSTRCE